MTEKVFKMQRIQSMRLPAYKLIPLILERSPYKSIAFCSVFAIALKWLHLNKPAAE